MVIKRRKKEKKKNEKECEILRVSIYSSVCFREFLFPSNLIISTTLFGRIRVLMYTLNNSTRDEN